MASQSETLAMETSVMRQFDRALQAAAGLPERAAGRVLRYVAERVADELPQPPAGAFVPSTAVHWAGGQLGGGGGGGSAVTNSPGTAGGNGGG